VKLGPGLSFSWKRALGVTKISTLFGVWLAPIGLVVASLGFWLSTARSQN
jgi:hypothetical protein